MKRQLRKRKTKYHKLDAEKFVRAWQASKSREEARKRYGALTINQMSSAATNLRRRGVKLKRFSGARGECHDYVALARLAMKAKA